ncbi:hypothetical protein IE53DRAFT_368129 [Violaceomyces palustris]|uniref:Uncharacterized protein n=1 Tax=Violaceomyces palustris TaxID=1673888 RepID=A0ACD0NZX7_9BASI|nr:hypothetical protein IE53DRAFT_368129 [Violaceomyces palustris]
MKLPIHHAISFLLLTFASFILSAPGPPTSEQLGIMKRMSLDMLAETAVVERLVSPTSTQELQREKNEILENQQEYRSYLRSHPIFQGLLQDYDNHEYQVKRSLAAYPPENVLPIFAFLYHKVKVEPLDDRKGRMIEWSGLVDPENPLLSNFINLQKRHIQHFDNILQGFQGRQSFTEKSSIWSRGVGTSKRQRMM